MKTKEKTGEYIDQEVWKGVWWVLLHNPRKIFNKILQYFAMHYFCPPKIRGILQSWRGVRFKDPTSMYIGDNVSFDERVLENITVGVSAAFSPGVRVITHKYVNHGYAKVVKVDIGDYAFIGVDAVIIGDVKIGEYSIVGACSVVTRDVEPYSIVAGNPAKKVGEVRKDRDEIDYLEGDTTFDPINRKYIKK